MFVFCVHPSEAVSDSTPCGTTTFIIPRMSRSPAAARRTTAITAGEPTGIYLGRKMGLPLSRTTLCLAKATSRHTSPGYGAGPFCKFLRESRSDRKFRPGRPYPYADAHGRCRALTALLLLAPNTPMLFMGRICCAPTISLLCRNSLRAF
jgi:hypothetical protein